MILSLPYHLFAVLFCSNIHRENHKFAIKRQLENMLLIYAFITASIDLHEGFYCQPTYLAQSGLPEGKHTEEREKRKATAIPLETSDS